VRRCVVHNGEWRVDCGYLGTALRTSAESSVTTVARSRRCHGSRPAQRIFRIGREQMAFRRRAAFGIACAAALVAVLPTVGAQTSSAARRRPPRIVDPDMYKNVRGDTQSPSWIGERGETNVASARVTWNLVVSSCPARIESEHIGAWWPWWCSPPTLDPLVEASHRVDGWPHFSPLVYLTERRVWGNLRSDAERLPMARMTRRWGLVPETCLAVLVPISALFVLAIELGNGAVRRRRSKNRCAN
jgi:hypothetical protein